MNRTLLKYSVIVCTLIVSLAGCRQSEDGNFPTSYANNNSGTPPADIPSTVTLTLGESVTFDNGMRTITFNAVLEENRVFVNGGFGGNAKIQLGLISTGIPYSFVELNTHTSPQSYNWEYGENISLQLVQLSFGSDPYTVTLKLTRYAYL